MSNTVKKPRVFAWHIGGPALRTLGYQARDRAEKRREIESDAKRLLERPARPYSPGRAEKEGMKSRYPKR